MTTMHLIANFIWMVLQLIANSIWELMHLIANFIKQGVPLKESLVFALKRKREGSRSSLLLGNCRCDSRYSPSGFLSSVRTVENLFTTKIIWWRRGHCQRCVCWCKLLLQGVSKHFHCQLITVLSVWKSSIIWVCVSHTVSPSSLTSSWVLPSLLW